MPRSIVKCTTQAELDAALKRENVDIWLVGAGEFWISDSSQVTASGSSQVTASDSSQVTAYDSSQVRAYGSSQVTASDSSQVTASGSSQVRAYDSSQVTAYGSSQVTAYDSSQVRASGSSQVTASGSSQVTASKFVAVTRHGTIAKVDGGVLIQIPEIKTPADWCEYYDVTVVDGIVTLYKGVGADFKSPHGADYTPGTMPSAPDWKATDACGNGLHFSPRPILTLRYNAEAKKYVACGVRLDELIVITEGVDVPDKCKAQRVVTPCVECDIDGNLIASTVTA